MVRRGKAIAVGALAVLALATGIGLRLPSRAQPLATPDAASSLQTDASAPALDGSARDAGLTALVPETAWRVASIEAKHAPAYRERARLPFAHMSIRLEAVNGKLIVSAGNRYVVDVETGRVTLTVRKGDEGMPHYGGHLAGSFLVSDDRELTARDLLGHSPPVHLRMPTKWSATDEILASAALASGRIVAASYDELLAFDPETGALAWQRAVPHMTVESLTVDGDDLFARTTREKASVIDARTGAVRLEIFGNNPEVIATTRSRLLVLDEGEGMARHLVVRLHDRTTGAELWRRELAAGRGRGACSPFCTDAALDERAAYVAVGVAGDDDDGTTVRAFDVASGAPLWRTPAMATDGGIAALGAKAGHVFVAGTSGEFRVLDAVDGSVRFRRGVDQVARLAFASDGSAWLASRWELIGFERVDDAPPAAERTVSGVAQVDGTPIANATIGVRGTLVKTDGAGNFSAVVVGEGPCVLEPFFGGSPRRPIVAPCEKSPFTVNVSSEDEPVGETD